MNKRQVRAPRLRDTILVGAGGALGAMARHGVEMLQPLDRFRHLDFPTGTLAINTAGSFVLGWVLAWSATRSGAPEWVRPFAGIGFCGAFTTFSTVTCELVMFARSGSVAVALVYVAASVVLGILAAAVGEWVAKGGVRG